MALTQCLVDIQWTPTVECQTLVGIGNNFAQQCCSKPAANKPTLTAVRGEKSLQCIS